MLILTRRPVESIYIGDEVTVTVLGVVGNQVRFGIEAPRNITIDRAEIHEKKKRAAANGNVVPPRNDGSREVNGNTLGEAPASEASGPAEPRAPVAVLKPRR